MSLASWKKLGKSRWDSCSGYKILKYRMTPTSTAYLLYRPGVSLDCGDYTSHGSFRDAKKAAESES